MRISIVALLFATLFPLCTIAQDKPAPSTRIKGCTVVVGFKDLRVFYERAVVVAEKETPPEGNYILDSLAVSEVESANGQHE